MSELVVLVPVLARPQKVDPFLTALFATVPDAHAFFVADPNDSAEIHAVGEAQKKFAGDDSPARISLFTRPGTYAKKIRAAVAATTEPLIFTGADDLEPKAGWLEAAKSKLADGALAVGVNDLIPRKRIHQTHFLMTREYAVTPLLDGTRGPFYTGYVHNFCDDEFIATAKHRGVYAYARESRVAHLHPDVRKAADDATYRKGRRSFEADRKKFQARSHLWT